MCGIAGKININSNTKVPTGEILEMISVLSHRGPDDEGIKILNNVGLGHKRLAIIDLSKKGHQPMTNIDGDIWVIFNGEIYNFQEIRAKLIQKGHKFNSNSDTEVIIAAYKEYGTDCLKHFRGMFSFALFDLKEDTLFAARDRIGKKPFHYFFDGYVFIFASEIKAILTQKEVSKEPDDLALRRYLYWGFVPSPQTGFKGISKLKAGHFLLLKKGKLTIRRYWHYQAKRNNLSEQDTIEKLRFLVEEAVKLRLISDVPLGAFLSGGIDSCVVVGIMSKLTQQPVQTFTIGFNGWQNNESSLAKISSKFHHTNHHQFIVSPNITKILPKVVKAYDEPFGDVSAIPSLFVSQIARKYVTVCLNGDGGDEDFLGYSNYEALLKSQSISFIRPFAMISNLLINNLSPSSPPFLERQKRLSFFLSKPSIRSYPHYLRGYMNYINFNDIYLTPFDLEAEFNRFLPPNAPDDISSVVTADFNSILPDSLMTKVDIASMQCSLETRSPLLDHKLVEFAASIPTKYKYKGGQTKYIFRKAFEDILPPEIINQPKRGFVMPVNDWFRHELKSNLIKNLSNRNHRLFTIVNFDTVQKIINLHLSTKMDYSPTLWRVLMLKFWFDEYL